MAQTTQEKAKQLLTRLDSLRSDVKYLEERETVLRAAASGKRILYRASADEWVQSSELTFTDPPEYYRVGPDVVKTRRFWWRSTCAAAPNRNVPTITMVTEADQLREPREDWKGFVGWIDTEWQEHEVPSNIGN